MATTTSRRLPTGQFVLGAIVVLVGVLLLLNSTGVFPTRDLLLYAPLLFVAVGVWALVQSRFRNVVGPAVLIGIAGAAQLIALGYATVAQVVVYWPVLVIAFGLSIVLGQYRSRVRHTDDAFTSAFAAFGGVEKRNSSAAFTGAELTAAFGGTELDLRGATIADPPARINAVAMFGGVEIIVPREWNVRLDVLPVLAGAADDRPRRDGEHEDVDLVVTGFAAFGEVSVTD
ncbi:LiaF transmembrane domain-containing protein [Salinilacihabitans rarus]|uniref:LiaF transmembrane domain-containing protein n=1 Tax=Salinilacihabitans rarus TaxID=2961596 RepID=UPI0020C8A9BB|nr:LiaF domain-containing protein [Salinilacihabitans rarus]